MRRGGDRTALAPHIGQLTSSDSETLDRMLATGHLEPHVSLEEEEHRSVIARRISELTRANTADAKTELERLRAEHSSWYPRNRAANVNEDDADKLAVFLGRLLGLEHLRVTNGWGPRRAAAPHSRWSPRPGGRSTAGRGPGRAVPSTCTRGPRSRPSCPRAARQRRAMRTSPRSSRSDGPRRVPAASRRC
ncbi:MAG: hypothetical protein JWP01_440 [Myxococcales bacterium]|nr:hypothetical protein [Myxococcales bacterium]